MRAHGTGSFGCSSAHRTLVPDSKRLLANPSPGFVGQILSVRRSAFCSRPVCTRWAPEEAVALHHDLNVLWLVLRNAPRTQLPTEIAFILAFLDVASPSCLTHNVTICLANPNLSIRIFGRSFNFLLPWERKILLAIICCTSLPKTTWKAGMAL